MDKRIIITALCSTLGLVNAIGFAQAETIGRLECNVVGPVSQEPIGDRSGHRLVSVHGASIGRPLVRLQPNPDHAIADAAAFISSR